MLNQGAVPREGKVLSEGIYAKQILLGFCAYTPRLLSSGVAQSTSRARPTRRSKDPILVAGPAEVRYTVISARPQRQPAKLDAGWQRRRRRRRRYWRHSDDRLR